MGRVIDLPKIVDPRGNLTVAEQMKSVPFEIRRVIGHMMCRRESIVVVTPIAIVVSSLLP